MINKVNTLVTIRDCSHEAIRLNLSAAHNHIDLKKYALHRHASQAKRYI